MTEEKNHDSLDDSGSDNTSQNIDTQDRGPALSAEDQAKVDKYLSSGVNSVERPPFRPLRLMFFLWGVLLVLGIISYVIAHMSGLV